MTESKRWPKAAAAGSSLSAVASSQPHHPRHRHHNRQIIDWLPSSTGDATIAPGCGDHRLSICLHHHRQCSWIRCLRSHFLLQISVLLMLLIVCRYVKMTMRFKSSPLSSNFDRWSVASGRCQAQHQAKLVTGHHQHHSKVTTGHHHQIRHPHLTTTSSFEPVIITGNHPYRLLPPSFDRPQLVRDSKIAMLTNSPVRIMVADDAQGVTGDDTAGAGTAHRSHTIITAANSAEFNDLDVDAFVPPGYDKLMPPKEYGKQKMLQIELL